MSTAQSERHSRPGCPSRSGRPPSPPPRPSVRRSACPPGSRPWNWSRSTTPRTRARIRSNRPVSARSTPAAPAATASRLPAECSADRPLTTGRPSFSTAVARPRPPSLVLDGRRCSWTAATSGRDPVAQQSHPAAEQSHSPARRRAKMYPRCVVSMSTKSPARRTPLTFSTGLVNIEAWSPCPPDRRPALTRPSPGRRGRVHPTVRPATRRGGPRAPRPTAPGHGRAARTADQCVPLGHPVSPAARPPVPVLVSSPCLPARDPAGRGRRAAPHPAGSSGIADFSSRRGRADPNLASSPGVRPSATPPCRRSGFRSAT